MHLHLIHISRVVVILWSETHIFKAQPSLIFILLLRVLLLSENQFIKRIFIFECSLTAALTSTAEA